MPTRINSERVDPKVLFDRFTHNIDTSKRPNPKAAMRFEQGNWNIEPDVSRAAVRDLKRCDPDKMTEEIGMLDISHFSRPVLEILVSLMKAVSQSMIGEANMQSEFIKLSRSMVMRASEDLKSQGTMALRSGIASGAIGGVTGFAGSVATGLGAAKGASATGDAAKNMASAARASTVGAISRAVGDSGVGVSGGVFRNMELRYQSDQKFDEQWTNVANHMMDGAYKDEESVKDERAQMINLIKTVLEDQKNAIDTASQNCRA